MPMCYEAFSKPFGHFRLGTIGGARSLLTVNLVFQGTQPIGEPLLNTFTSTRNLICSLVVKSKSPFTLVSGSLIALSIYD